MLNITERNILFDLGRPWFFFIFFFRSRQLRRRWGEGLPQIWPQPVCPYLNGQVFVAEDDLNMHWGIFHGIFIKFHGSAHGILQESHNIFIALRTAARLKEQSHLLCHETQKKHTAKLNFYTLLRTFGKYALLMTLYINISVVTMDVQHLKELKHHVVQMRRHIHHSNGFIWSFNCRGNTWETAVTPDPPCKMLMC